MNVQYRPYLYLSEIKLLIDKLNDEIPEEAATKRKLQLVAIKADAGLLDGSYTPTPRKNLEQRLEMDLDDEAIMAQIAAGVKK